MKSKDQYIDLLRLKCEEIISRPIKSNNDVAQLEIVLNRNISNPISFSSLRRFFGLVPQTKPIDKTLNKISEGLGYLNFTEFCKSTIRNNSWIYLNKLHELEFKAVLKDDEVYFIEKTSYNYPELFSYFLRQLLLNNNYSLLDRIFKLPKAFPKSDSDNGEIAQVIGEAVRKLKSMQLKKLGDLLVENQTLRKYILYYFVDYDGFFSNYFYLLRYVNKNASLTHEERLFYHLICRTKKYLRNKSAKRLLKLDEEIHPILYGRYIGHEIILKGNTTFNILSVPKSEAQSFFHELLPLIIINKDKSRLEIILDKYYEELITPGYNTFEDKQAIALISLAIRNINYLNFDAAKVNLSFLNTEEILPSHKNFLTILSFIPKYHIAVISKNHSEMNEITTKYILLSKQLNFSLFTIDYLENYFNLK